MAKYIYLGKASGKGRLKKGTSLYKKNYGKKAVFTKYKGRYVKIK